MPSEDSDSPKFVHRAAPNGAFESICGNCYRTIAVTWSEADLRFAEDNHICEHSVVPKKISD